MILPTQNKITPKLLHNVTPLASQLLHQFTPIGTPALSLF